MQKKELLALKFIGFQIENYLKPFAIKCKQLLFLEQILAG